MALASSLGYKLAVGKETVWGTPVAANGAYCRSTGGGPGRSATTSGMSREITRFENADVFRSRVQGGGSYNFEWSYSTADKELDAILESLFGGAWTVNVLKVGGTRKSITVEEQYTDITQLISYPGAFASGVSMNVGIGDAITGGWSYVSKPGVVAGTSVFTTTTAANSNPVMNPLDALQTLTWGGSAILNPTAFTMELSRTVIDFPQLSNINPADLAPGSFTAQGTFSCYFPDATYLTDYLAFTERALAITVGGASAKKYAFLFSKVNLTDGGVGAGSQNTPFVQTFNWASKADDAGTTSCQITRTP